MEGVVGIGTGRRFSESRGKYTRKSSRFGGLCIQIMVSRKRPVQEITKAQRIPKSIAIKLPNSEQGCRVPVDILTAGATRLQSATHRHVWPTSGRFNVGRIFAHDRVRTANKQTGQFHARQAELGTVSAVLRLGENSYGVVTAGHVFLNVCSGFLDQPGGHRRIGVLGRQWWALPPNNLAPKSLQNGSWIMDATLMRVPKEKLPATVIWPPLFDKRMATPDDIHAAIESDTVGGFVWVERGDGQCMGLPIDLQAGLEVFSPKVCPNRTTPYRYVWPYRLIGGDSQQTIGGDSGAGVFIPALDKRGFCRLLGFHFLHDSEAMRGYALDANMFFKRLFGAQAHSAFSFVDTITPS